MLCVLLSQLSCASSSSSPSFGCTALATLSCGRNCRATHRKLQTGCYAGQLQLRKPGHLAHRPKSRKY